MKPKAELTATITLFYPLRPEGRQEVPTTVVLDLLGQTIEFRCPGKKRKRMGLWLVEEGASEVDD